MRQKHVLIFSLILMFGCTFPLYQNCSQKKFESTTKPSNKMSGGEGYGGKVYRVVSDTQVCPDPQISPSMIEANSETDAYLLSKNCVQLDPAPKIAVTFAADPVTLFYDGDTYREVAVAAKSGATQWIESAFASYPVLTGDFTTRTNVEAPALVKNATGCCSKYSFDMQDNVAPNIKEIAFVNVAMKDMSSPDAFGSGLLNTTTGMSVFVANAYIEPNWPLFVDFTTTNYDGIVINTGAGFYADQLVVKNWNAHAAVDTKAQINQIVGLRTIGQGQDAIDFWRDGPHYIVNSSLNNSNPSRLIWINDCTSATIYVYNSTFNGAATANGQYTCGTGTTANIIYLTYDPRTTGEMHPMFTP
jgi:hypothetical protein